MPLTAALVDKVAYAVSRDETRYTLAGVLLEVEARKLKMVATDGKRAGAFRWRAASGQRARCGRRAVEGDYSRASSE